jgi:hypothetical protein
MRSRPLTLSTTEIKTYTRSLLRDASVGPTAIGYSGSEPAEEYKSPDTSHIAVGESLDPAAASVRHADRMDNAMDLNPSV